MDVKVYKALGEKRTLKGCYSNVRGVSAGKDGFLRITFSGTGKPYGVSWYMQEGDGDVDSIVAVVAEDERSTSSTAFYGSPGYQTTRHEIIVTRRQRAEPTRHRWVVELEDKEK